MRYPREYPKLSITTTNNYLKNNTTNTSDIDYPFQKSGEIRSRKSSWGEI